jgi:hypothetical protein
MHYTIPRYHLNKKIETRFSFFFIFCFFALDILCVCVCVCARGQNVFMSVCGVCTTLIASHVF